MENNRWPEIERIFDETLELPEAARAAFLAQACQGDEALRREVESLLNAARQANDFLLQPAAQLSLRTVLPNTSTLTAQQRIGPYHLLREIAHGGMGTVWLAERADEQYQQQVAIKLLNAGANNPDIAQRLRHERQILADLNHPNIARLLDGGTTDSGQPYLVMEYIAGVPIDAYCQQQQLSLRERLQLFRQVCAAVQYAHQHLIIHRDLKPANILVTADGTPKLLDFGIAKLLQPDLAQSHQTQAGQTPMTPAYASPEQMRSQPLTTTSDVYSLGVVLYELLTNRSPYQLTTNTFGELSRAICEQDPLKPSIAVTQSHPSNEARQFFSLRTPHSALRTLKGDLDSIVLMALRKEPGARYASVEQFSADIQRYLDGLPTLARKGTLAYRAVKYVRRYKVPVAAAALILVSLLSGIGATSRQAQIARAEQVKAEAQRIRAEQALAIADEQRTRAEQALAEVKAERTRAEHALTTAEQGRQQADAARTEANQQRAEAETQRLAAEAERNVAQTQRQRAETQELSNRQLLYTSRMGLAQQAWNDSDVGRAREMLTPYLPQADAPDFRGFEWYYLWKLSHQEQKTLPLDGTIQWMGFTPDGQQFIAVSRNGNSSDLPAEIKVMDTSTWEVSRQFSTSNATMFVGSDDRQVLAQARRGGAAITLLSLLTGEKLKTIEGLKGGISCLAFAPDGKAMVVGFLDGSLSQIDLQTGKEVRRNKEHKMYVFTVAVSPDNERFLSASDDGDVNLWELNSWQPISRLNVRPHPPQNSLFSPDGKMMVVTGSGWLTAWDVASGNKLTELKRQGRRVVFSPDSKTLVIGGEDATNQTEISVLDTHSWQLQDVIKGHGNWIMSLAFSLDGNALVSGSLDHKVKLWDITKTATVNSINDQARKGGEFTQAALSSDGKRIIVGQTGEAAVVWDVETGKELAVLKGHQTPSAVDNLAFAVAISPNGDKYATGGLDAQVIIWDTATGKERQRFTNPSKINSLQFAPDGQSIAAGGARGVIVWELSTGKKLASLPSGNAVATRYTRDGQHLFTAGPDPFVRLWDIASGTIQRAFRCGDSNVFSFALAADESIFVTGGGNGAHVWDAQTGQERAFLNGHTSVVSAVAISPNGKRIVTGGYDRIVRVWDVATAQELIAFRNHNSWICNNSIAFSADGRLLITASWDRIVNIWRAAAEQEVKVE